MKMKQAIKFIPFSENDNGEWIDTSFMDNCRNAALREWRLSTNTITGETYATLLRAASPDHDFEFCASVPRKLVDALEQSA